MTYNEGGEAEGITLKAHLAKIAHLERTHSDQLGAAKRKLDSAHTAHGNRRPYERDRYHGGSSSNSYSGGGNRDRDHGNRDR